MTGLLACALFKIGRHFGPPEFVEALGGAPKISGRIDGRVIGAHQCDDVSGYRHVWMRKPLLFISGKCETDGAVEQPNCASSRARARHWRREWVEATFRPARIVEPNLAGLRGR